MLDGGSAFSQISKMKLLAESAGVVIVSDYLWHKWVAPMVFGLDSVV